MNASNLLAAAADLIETDGWCQGMLRSDGKHCAIGAIDTTARRGSFSAPEVHAAEKLLRTEVGPNIATWNDRPGRTQADVVDALRRAAQIGREQ